MGTALTGMEVNCLHDVHVWALENSRAIEAFHFNKDLVSAFGLEV
jgi:hypothetical protein